MQNRKQWDTFCVNLLVVVVAVSFTISFCLFLIFLEITLCFIDDSIFYLRKKGLKTEFSKSVMTFWGPPPHTPKTYPLNTKEECVGKSPFKMLGRLFFFSIWPSFLRVLSIVNLFRYLWYIGLNPNIEIRPNLIYYVSRGIWSQVWRPQRQQKFFKPFEKIFLLSFLLFF